MSELLQPSEQSNWTPESDIPHSSEQTKKALGSMSLRRVVGLGLENETLPSEITARIGSRTPEERANNLEAGFNLMLEEHKSDPGYFDRMNAARDRKAQERRAKNL